jgi:ankyrin repeat protein
MKTLLAVICSAIVFNCTQNLHMTEQVSYVKTGEEDFGMDENTMHEDNNDLTVFDYFLEDNSDDETIIFLQGKQANIPNLFLKLYPTINEEFEGLIHHAVELGSLEIIKKIFELTDNKQALVNLKTSADITPLHLAAFRGDVSVIEYLIKAGADIKAIDNEKNSLLHYAIKNNSCSIGGLIELFEKERPTELKGLLLSIDDEDNSTLLHWAVLAYNKDALQTLLIYFSANASHLIE